MRKLTQQEFIDKANVVHNNYYNYEKTTYVNNKTSVEIICPNHGSFWQIPMHHLKGSGCAKCDDVSRIKTLDNFICEAHLIHLYKYDYSLVDYKNAKTKIEIICPIHGCFVQTPAQHLSGAGCEQCAHDRKSYSTIEYIEQASQTHSHKYDYSNVVYYRSDVKIDIICPIHGLFSQLPNVHLFGHGCPICGVESKKTLLSEFILQASKIHNNEYDYSLVAYINSYTKIKIICLKHNSVFEQTPFSHLQGKGCPKCHRAVSKQETLWLDVISVPQEYRHKTIFIDDKYYKVDAYDPVKNIVYEFYGDYWHGNPQVFFNNDINKSVKVSFGELYLKTIKKEQEIKQAGYGFVSIWENDFKSLYQNKGILV